MDHPDDIQHGLRALARGLAQGQYSVAYDGYKALFQIGTRAVPVLSDVLLSIEWSGRSHKDLTRYVAGLLALLRDLDEDEAERVREAFEKGGCPRHIEALARSLCSFTLKDFKRYRVRAIDVFEHEGLGAQCDVRAYLDRWLGRVPDGDLKSLSRLYVVRKDEMPQAEGRYMPVLFNVAILWDNRFKEGSLAFRARLLFTELTLYHEIGHHVHRHSFGQQPAQEREANRYARRILTRHHPIIGAALWLLSPLARFCPPYYGSRYGW